MSGWLVAAICITHRGSCTADQLQLYRTLCCTTGLSRRFERALCARLGMRCISTVPDRSMPAWAISDTCQQAQAETPARRPGPEPIRVSCWLAGASDFYHRSAMSVSPNTSHAALLELIRRRHVNRFPCTRLFPCRRGGPGKSETILPIDGRSSASSRDRETRPGPEPEPHAKTPRQDRTRCSRTASTRGDRTPRKLCPECSNCP
jgi:hypothetical protein